MEKYLVNLSKQMSQALRHAPWQYELELDPDGWVTVDSLIAGIEENRDHRQKVTVEDFERIIAEGDKKRYEMKDGRIRALYGHSVPARIIKEPAEPPATLYHGTVPAALEAIRTSGLKPMRRQYVHLSPDMPTATIVATRRGKPVILQIDAAGAYAAGHQFYLGNEMVWLADAVPSEFITFPD